MFLAEKIFALIRDSGPRRDMHGRECIGLTPMECAVLLGDTLSIHRDEEAIRYTIRNLICHMERRGIVGVSGRASSSGNNQYSHRIYRALMVKYPARLTDSKLARSKDYYKAPSRNKLYKKLRRAGVPREEAAKAAGVIVGQR